MNSSFYFETSIETSHWNFAYISFMSRKIGTYVVKSQNCLFVILDTYGAVICQGTFAPGHMDQGSFPELTRITKPGMWSIVRD